MRTAAVVAAASDPPKQEQNATGMDEAEAGDDVTTAVGRPTRARARRAALSEGRAEKVPDDPSARPSARERAAAAAPG